MLSTSQNSISRKWTHSFYLICVSTFSFLIFDIVLTKRTQLLLAQMLIYTPKMKKFPKTGYLKMTKRTQLRPPQISSCMILGVILNSLSAIAGFFGLWRSRICGAGRKNDMSILLVFNHLLFTLFTNLLCLRTTNKELYTRTENYELSGPDGQQPLSEAKWMDTHALMR